MPDQAITMNLDPGAHRQLGEDGLIVLWRDGRELRRREGLACAGRTPNPATSAATSRGAGLKAPFQG
jgi:hypothetical protein